MRILPLLVISTLLNCLSLFAQYDAGRVIYSENNSSTIQKNYKIVDFDYDNYVDILFIKDGSPNQLTWYKGDGSGNFYEQENLLEINDNHKENEIFYENMNEDGINDIVFQNSDSGFTILLNDGQDNISTQVKNEATTTEEFVGVYLKDLADIDGDGDIDGIFFAKEGISLVPQLSSNDYGYCLVGYNDGNGNFTNYEYLDRDKHIFKLMETGDVDGDGDVDIICSGNKFEDYLPPHENPFIRIYENLGTNGMVAKLEVDLPKANNTEAGLINIILEDINSDGAVELLVEYAFLYDCENDVHLYKCSYTHQFHVMHYDVNRKTFMTLQAYDSWLHGYTLSQNFRILYDDDILIRFGQQNNDDNLDALSVNVPQGKLLWYLGNGKGGFEPDQSQTVHISNEYSTNKPALQLADVDNNGDLDVFVLLNTETSSTLTVFKNETTVSINNNFVLGKMSISPNPISGNSYVQLELPQNQNTFNLTYNIFTIKGEKLKTGICKDSRIFIPGLSNGMYLIEILSEDKRYFEKLIIR